MRVSLLLALSLVASSMGLAGCIGALDDGQLSLGTSSEDATDAVDTASESIPVPDGETYEMAPWSRTLEEGPHDILEPEVIEVEGPDGVQTTAAIWKPSSVEDGEEVPVVVDAGPYYGQSDVPVDEPALRLGAFLINNYVPHGYAVVQLSVRGTGQSEGCADFLGPKEQADVDAAVTRLGEADWSNGNVSLIGRSYDGTTPFEAATFDNDHLSTIVPISGLSDVGDLYYRNGTSEVRAPILGTIYTAFSVTGADEPQDMARPACPETAEHPIFGTQGWMNGGRDMYAEDAEYWEVRDYQERILENYDGSVFMVHGLQDWNVDPHMAYPYVNRLMDAGIETKVWAGQWEHNYPDRNHSHIREDWAETLLHWFDSELKGEDVDTGPVVETEDNRGNWRTAEAWPPRDTTDETYYLGADGLASSADEATEATRVLYDPPTEAEDEAAAGPSTDELAFVSEPLDEEIRVVGMPTLHVDVTPSTNGGALYAEMVEVTEDGEEILVGHSSMDLRYHDGGKTKQVVTPGERVTAKMQFLPMDVLLKEGSQLKVTLEQNHFAFLPAPQQGPVEVHVGDDASPLTLPLGETGNVHHTIDGVDPASTWG